MRALAAAAVLLSLSMSAEAVQPVDTLTANRWRMPVSVDARFGQEATWRFPTHSYLFGCGPWVGAVFGPETLVTCGYNPNSGGTEMAPGDSLGGGADTLVGVYVSGKVWPPPLSRFPRAPQATLADQDLWTCFNDFDSSAHIMPGRPLGVQVYLTGHEWVHWSAQDMVFLQYEVENQSADTLRGVFFGVALDYDIGVSTDDGFAALYHRWVSGPGGDSVYVDHLAIGYDAGNSEPGWDTVGAFGVSVLRSPGAERVSAIKKFTIDIDPVTDPEQYLTLAGYNYRTGEYVPFDTAPDQSPADKRFLLATGPLDIAAGQTDTLVIVICAATDWPDRYGLARQAVRAESIWAQGRPGVAEPPGPPRPALRTAPAIVRGSLVLSRELSADSRQLILLDASGRKVMGLVPGRNDVRHLLPGVYFIHSEPSAVSRRPSAVWKVVVTR